MDKRWIVKRAKDAELARIASELAGVLGKPVPVARLLKLRAPYISTKEEADFFFTPQWKVLDNYNLPSEEELSDYARYTSEQTQKCPYNPFLLKDMDKAVQRIQKALEKQEKILIFGDYDVDGTSAVALMYSFINRYISPEYYVPDRYNEGYGISDQAVEYAHDNGFTLMIVLDCGIKCHEQIDLASTYGIDVIVCDHHLPDKDEQGIENLPQAYAVLDPKRGDCAYPDENLSGCGMGFKLVQALAKSMNIPFEKEIFPFLDLVAISIASDIVPILGENRILAYWGLKIINRNPRKGIETILSYSKIHRVLKGGHNDEEVKRKHTVFNQLIRINDLVFNVGPRINAAGRMDTEKGGRRSVHLLISEEEDKTRELGDRINGWNTERKEMDKKITEEAKELIDNDPNSSAQSSITVYKPEWNKGVIGIVASRLVECYYKPTIVMSLSNDIITGSSRSVQGFDLYGALCKCSHLLEHFGGHMYAAGLSLKPENLEAFRKAFENAVAESIDENSKCPTIEIDEEVNLRDIQDPLFFNEIQKFEPFGPENLAPIFLTRNVSVEIKYGEAPSVQRVGKDKKHLKLRIFQKEERSYIPFDAIAFDMGNLYERIHNEETFDICYHVQMNEWQNQRKLQLLIKDIKFTKDIQEDVDPVHQHLIIR